MDYPNDPANWDDVAALVHSARDKGLPLDPRSPVSIDYFVYGGTVDECRFRYESIVSALKFRFYGTHRYIEGSREHEGTTQHLMEVYFGSGTAVYRVIWIERHEPTTTTMDIPLSGGMQP